MRVRKNDANGDWNFGKGKSNYARDLLATQQNINTRLKSFLGDCFFSLNDGINWFELLGGKSENDLKLAVSTTIIKTENVLELIEVSFERNAERKATIQYSAKSVYGEINSSVTVGEF